MTALLWRGLRGTATLARWMVAAPILLVTLLIHLAVAVIAAYLVGLAIVLTLHFGFGIVIERTAWELALLVTLLAVFGLVAVTLWAERTGVALWFRRGAGDSHGSARFASKRDRAAYQHGTGLLIGRDPENRKLLRYDGPAHLLTLAPTRAGKGVGTVIPNLLSVDRSVLVIDPKGENARIAGEARRRFGAVHVLDPFSVTGLPSSAYNPLALLTPDSLDLGEDAASLSEALVMDPPGQVSEAHWNEEAKALLSGLIMFAVSHEEDDRRTLGTVREYLTLPPDRFRTLLELMQDSDAAGGLVARAANRFLGKSDREASSVLSSAQRHTHFLDSPRIAKATARSDFRFATLRREVTSVFLVLPPNRLDAYSRWLRLLVAQALSDIARDAEVPAAALGGAQDAPALPDAATTAQSAAQRLSAPTLFLLDEFAALGRLEAVERAMGLMAGYGLQLWPILQDMSQLKDLYGTRANTFVANAGVLQTFGVNDYETAKWLSHSMGQETAAYRTESYRPGDAPSTSVNVTSRALLTPDEIMQVPAHIQLLRIQGQPTIAARKLRYFADPEFDGLFVLQVA